MIVQVQVKTGSKKGPLIEMDGANLIVYLREKPHDGEANAALTAMLAKHFKVAKSCVIIKAGAKSHHKTIEIL